MKMYSEVSFSECVYIICKEFIYSMLYRKRISLCKLLGNHYFMFPVMGWKLWRTLLFLI